MKDEIPDVFIVPPKVIYDDKFQKHLEKRRSRPRWHPRIEYAKPYKNNWYILRDYPQSVALIDTDG